jgi:transcriptional regulator with XRE-family HTH domain
MIETFESKFRRICKTKGLTVPQACKMAGVNYGTLNAQFRRKSQISLEMTDDICRGLDVPISYFSKYSPTMGITSESDTNGVALAAANLMDAAINAAHMQALMRQSKISTMDVLNWLRSTNGRLENFDAIKDSVDLFHVMGAEDQIPNPYRIGKESLATVNFEIEDEDHYRLRLKAFDRHVLKNIKVARIKASDHNYMVSDVNMIITLDGKRIELSYRRVIAKVYLPDDQELTLVHSELLPSNRQEDREATDLDLIQPPTNQEVVPLAPDRAK